jgi:hypothetical protein
MAAGALAAGSTEGRRRHTHAAQFALGPLPANQRPHRPSGPQDQPLRRAPPACTSGVARSSRSTSASASAPAVAPTASVSRRTGAGARTTPVTSSSQKAARAKGTSAPRRTAPPNTRAL